MYLSELTDQSIVDLHDVIREAAISDPAGAMRTLVRDCGAWRIHADAYETEMTARAVPFIPIDWRQG